MRLGREMKGSEAAFSNGRERAMRWMGRWRWRQGRGRWRRTVARASGGGGERWRALRNHAIRERRIKENTQSERASAKWTAVASQARKSRRRGGNWPRLPGLYEARRGAIYSRRDRYETSTLRNKEQNQVRTGQEGENVLYTV